MHTKQQIRLIQYVISYHVVCGISIAMCYLDALVDNISNTLQNFLIEFFMFLSWVVLIVGATRTFPQDKFSNKRIWFYCAIMGGSIAATHTFVKLISILKS